MSTNRKCHAKTRENRNCKSYAQSGSDFCHAHKEEDIMKNRAYYCDLCVKYGGSTAPLGLMPPVRSMSSERPLLLPPPPPPPTFLLDEKTLARLKNPSSFLAGIKSNPSKNSLANKQKEELGISLFAEEAAARARKYQNVEDREHHIQRMIEERRMLNKQNPIREEKGTRDLLLESIRGRPLVEFAFRHRRKSRYY